MTAAAVAQDTRTVTEPVFPAVCSTLQAQLTMALGEPSSETAFDTTRIQNALNACASGKALELQTNGSMNAFLIQPISIPSGVTLLVDGGVTVFGSRNPADYQISTGETCGTIGTKGGGCNPLIILNNGNPSTGSGVMGYGVINGRGSDTMLVGGVSSGQNWWDVTNSTSTSRTQNKPVMLNAGGATNFTLYKITFANAPYFHVQWDGSGFTVWDVKVISPGSSPNTDGIDPSGSNVTITNSSLSGGDDNIAVKASNACSAITVSNINTYSGHGISIGSQTQAGLTGMLVQNINQYGDGPTAGGTGLRLKSDPAAGGLVQNVTYRNVCSYNVNYPVVIDPNYDSRTGTLIPAYNNILYQNIHVIGTKGKFQIQGYDVNHLTTVTLDNFVVDSLPQTYITPAWAYATITLGPGPVSPTLLQTQTGTSLSYNGNITNPTEAPYTCTTTGFALMTGELYLSTSGTTNLKTLTTATTGPFTLNAILQPGQSEYSYVSYQALVYTGAPVPTAAVQFLEGSTVVGTGTLGGNGTIASATLPGATVGAHTYTAYYPGDAYYPAYTFGSVNVTISALATATVVGLSPATIYDGGVETLTATVTAGSGPPTGSVTFYNGTVSLGSATLTAGVGKLMITPIVIGNESITAVYTPTGSYIASTSPAVTLSVVAPFTLTASTSSISLQAGASGDLLVSLNPAGGFSGTVSSTCTTAVAYVTCVVAPFSVTVSGNTTLAVGFNVAPTVSTLRRSGDQRGWYALLLPLGVFVLAGAGRRRNRYRLLALLLMLAGSVAGASGCSGGKPITPNLPPISAQTATVTASTTNTAGTLSQTAQITVNITN